MKRIQTRVTVFKFSVFKKKVTTDPPHVLVILGSLKHVCNIHENIFHLFIPFYKKHSGT